MQLNGFSLGIIIPSYDESERLHRFLEQLFIFLANKKNTSEFNLKIVHLVLVDDASDIPVNVDWQKMIPCSHFTMRVHVLRHAINLGQGASLHTGIQYARQQLLCDFFITMDADGQHRPQDIIVLWKKLLESNSDICFGNRFLMSDLNNIPRARKIILRGALFFEQVITGLKLGDAHNGFRCFNRKAAFFLRLNQNQMAHATEFKQIVAKNHLRYTEAPVLISYTEETLHKGQSNWNSLRILKDLVKVYLFGRT